MGWRVVPRGKISSTLTNPHNDPLRRIRPKEERPQVKLTGRLGGGDVLAHDGVVVRLISKSFCVVLECGFNLILWLGLG